jgi:carboxylesterase type B
MLRTDQSFDSSALPPACSQPTTYLGDLEQSEDCLYAVVYVPKGLKPIGGLPVYVW